MRVSWRPVASIFATVAISPWNLLVGGLLIQHLSFVYTLLAILGGYSILGVIFVTYGGLGFKYRKQSAEILERVFPFPFIKYAIPLVLAIGQIGWAGINFELGGKSLGILLSVPSVIGIFLYATLLILWAQLNIKRLGFTKYFVVAASIALMAWVGMQKLHTTSFALFLTHQPASSDSLFWGLSVVVASFISFATVSPDFFKDVEKKKDIGLSTLFGIILPGSLTALLGAFLFFDRNNFDLIALISASSFFLFPHLFNTITNTDGTVATLIAGLKFEHLFRLSYKKAVFLAGGISFVLALMGISSHLELWLKILSILFPVFIGICFPSLVYQQYKKRLTYKTNLVVAFASSLLISLCLFLFFPPVLVALLAPLVIFSVSLSYISLSLFTL